MSRMQPSLEYQGTFATNYGASGRGAPVNESKLLDGTYDINKLSTEQLQFELERRGLPVDGNKLVLRDRLLDYLLSKLKWRADKLVSDAKLHRDAVAKEQSGSVYATGLHAHATDDIIEGFALVPGLSGCKPVEVVAGDDYVLVLTQAGEVLAYGRRDAPIFNITGTGVIAARDHTAHSAVEQLSSSKLVASISTRGTAGTVGDASSPKWTSTQNGAGRRAAESNGGFGGKTPSDKSREMSSFVWGEEPRRAEAAISPSKRTELPKATNHTAGTATTMGHFCIPHIVQGCAGENVASLRAGYGYAGALTATQDILLWGSGSLGHAQLTSKPQDVVNFRPVAISPFETTGAFDIVFGGMHALLLDEEGIIYSWGLNKRACLGLPAGEDDVTSVVHRIPTPIPFFISMAMTVTHVACSSMHALAAVHEPIACTYSWGKGDGFRLGHGDVLDVLQPTAIAQLTGFRVHGLIASSSTSFAITDNEAGIEEWHEGAVDRRVWAWGTGIHGQLGLGDDVQQAPTPMPIVLFETFKKQVTKIAASSTHTAALTADQELFVWGTNKFGALGMPSDESAHGVFEPARVLQVDCLVNGVGRGKPISVACGRYTTIVACAPFSLSEDTRVVEKDAFLENAEAAKRLEELARVKAMEDAREADRIAAIVEENRKKFRSAQPCTLCEECPGFAHDEISPTLCLRCGHLRTRHNTGK